MPFSSWWRCQPSRSAMQEHCKIKHSAMQLQCILAGGFEEQQLGDSLAFTKWKASGLRKISYLFTFFYLFAVLNTYLNHLIIFILLLLTHFNYQFTPLGHLSVRLPKNISSHNKIPSLFLSHSLSSYLRSHYGSPSPLPPPSTKTTKKE